MQRRKFITLLGGAVATWPLAAQAQQPAMPVIGFLRNTSPDVLLVAAFRRGLNEAGYIEGQNVAIARTSAHSHHDSVPREPDCSATEQNTKEAQTAAHLLGLQLLVLNASSERNFETAFATLVQQRAGALVINPDTLFTSHPNQLVALAARHAVPTIYYRREAIEAGGL